jgi:hypothetical protein
VATVLNAALAWLGLSMAMAVVHVYRTVLHGFALCWSVHWCVLDSLLHIASSLFQEREVSRLDFLKGEATLGNKWVYLHDRLSCSVRFFGTLLHSAVSACS